MMHKVNHLLEFGEHRADVAQRLLFRGEEQIPLAPKAFDTLLVLLEAGGQVVSKEDLLKAVWPGTFVEEGSLARNISLLRKVLGDSVDDQRYIQTIPKRGYRFLATVREASLPDTPAPLEPAATPPPKPRNWGTAAIAVLALCTAAGLLYWQLASPSPTVRSIAVLPLSNLSNDASQEHFADGVTDTIITNLAQIPTLRITSRTSILRYKGTTRPLPDIARELGVDAILVGSVRHSGNQVRITAQLIHAATDSHLWARTYEGDVADTFRLEGELATDIARQVKAQLAAETNLRLRNAPRISAKALEEFNEARRQQDFRDASHLPNAVHHFELAIAAEPAFAAAHAHLARAWMQQGIFGKKGLGAVEHQAREAALRALQLDPNLAEAHSTLGQILYFYDFAWQTAESEFQRALQLDPSNVSAHIYYAVLLEALGRPLEAIAAAERAVALDPLSVTTNSELGRVLFRARKYPEAIQRFQRTLELDPNNAPAKQRLADVYMQIGKLDEARALLQEMPARLARLEALAGRKQEALKAFAAMDKGPGSQPMDVALTLFALGRLDDGFRALTEGFDRRGFVVVIGCDPRFDSVRGDPRFTALLARLHLPQSAARK